MIYMNELITELLNYAFDEGISIQLNGELSPDTPPIADTDANKIIINLNWRRKRQIPLQICHEIAHIKHHDAKRSIYAFSSIFSDPKDELSADTYAIRMLIPRFMNGTEPEDINAQNFIDCFDIPGHLSNVVERELHNYVRSMENE